MNFVYNKDPGKKETDGDDRVIINELCQPTNSENSHRLLVASTLNKYLTSIVDDIKLLTGSAIEINIQITKHEERVIMLEDTLDENVRGDEESAIQQQSGVEEPVDNEESIYYALPDIAYEVPEEEDVAAVHHQAPETALERETEQTIETDVEPPSIGRLLDPPIATEPTSLSAKDKEIAGAWANYDEEDFGKQKARRNILSRKG